MLINRGEGRTTRMLTLLLMLVRHSQFSPISYPTKYNQGCRKHIMTTVSHAARIELQGMLPHAAHLRNAGEDWTGITDQKARKKLQNRLNKRICTSAFLIKAIHKINTELHMLTRIKTSSHKAKDPIYKTRQRHLRYHIVRPNTNISPLIRMLSTAQPPRQLRRVLSGNNLAQARGAAPLRRARAAELRDGRSVRGPRAATHPAQHHQRADAQCRGAGVRV